MYMRIYIFFVFWVLYAFTFQYLELKIFVILDTFWTKKIEFDLYAGRLIREYIRYLLKVLNFPPNMTLYF
jgi:hypothetical protein